MKCKKNCSEPVSVMKSEKQLTPTHRHFSQFINAVTNSDLEIRSNLTDQYTICYPQINTPKQIISKASTKLGCNPNDQ